MTTAESARSGEYIPVEEFNDFLNGVGNHEAKLLTTILLYQDPNRWFSAQDQKTELNGRQLARGGWHVGPTIPISYCRESLEPIGAVAKGLTLNDSGRYVTAYKAIAEKRTAALALCGGLAEWSLLFPMHSVQQVFGKTQTTGGVRSPQMRFVIYADLLTSPADVSQHGIGVSLGIEESDEISQAYVQSQIEKMEELGIVSFRSRLRNFDPLLEVCSPFHPPRNGGAGDDRLALNAALNGLELHQRIRRSELIEIVQSIKPDSEAKHIKQKISGLISRKQRIQIVDDSEKLQHTSSVSIAPEYRDAITRLVHTLTDIQVGQRLSHYADVALRIINDPAATTTLMAKARDASSFASRVEGLQPMLVEITRKAGCLTVEAAQKEVLNSTGRKITATRLRGVFTELAKRGFIVITREPSRADSRRTQNLYRISEA